MVKSIKKLWSKPVLAVVGVLLLFGLILSGRALFGNGEPAAEEAAGPRPVRTIKLAAGNGGEGLIKTVGTIKAKSKIEAVSLGRGAVRGVYFSVGDSVRSGQLLASLSDSFTLASLASAETGYSNLLNSQLVVERLAAESVRQAEIGVQAGTEAVAAAEIGLKSALDALDNYRSLTDKTGDDLRINAAAAYPGYLNAMYGSLDLADEVIRAEESALRPGASLTDPGLGAKDLGSLRSAYAAYWQAKNAYNAAAQAEQSPDTVKGDLPGAIAGLEAAKSALDALVYLLDSSVAGNSLSDSWISSQKTAAQSQRNALGSILISAKAAQQSLENTKIAKAGDESSLENAVLAARNRLRTAEISRQNSLTALENARQGAEAQKISAKIALDGAQSQLRLARIQAGDLDIKAPVSGRITARFAEPGMELGPGAPVAEISDTALLTVEADLSATDIGEVRLGQTTFLAKDGQEWGGTVTKIFPTADPLSKKVRVEIAYAGGGLLPESFIDVSLPTAAPADSAGKLFIPLSAVTVGANETFVFVAENARAKKTVIATGENRGLEIEAVSGLKSGDELIVEGAKLLENGEAISILD